MILMTGNIIEKKNIKYLVVHCSDTNDDENIDSLEIHKMHLKFGWDGIGYHKIICRNGDIQNGRPEFWIGAHARGFNKVSLGVCLIGKNKFTDCQFRSLKKVLVAWKKKYTKSKIIGHNLISDSKKTCPNFNVKNWCTIRGIN